MFVHYEVDAIINTQSLWDCKCAEDNFEQGNNQAMIVLVLAGDPHGCYCLAPIPVRWQVCLKHRML